MNSCLLSRYVRALHQIERDAIHPACQSDSRIPSARPYTAFLYPKRQRSAKSAQSGEIPCASPFRARPYAEDFPGYPGPETAQLLGAAGIICLKRDYGMKIADKTDATGGSGVMCKAFPGRERGVSFEGIRFSVNRSGSSFRFCVVPVLVAVPGFHQAFSH